MLWKCCTQYAANFSLVALLYIDGNNTSFSQWLFASCYSISFIHLLFKNINVSEGLYAIRNIVIPLALTANLAYYFDLKFEHCRSCAFMLSHFSCGRLSETLAHQAPLSMGFSGPKYQIGLSCHSPGDLPDPGMEPMSLTSPPLAGRLRMLL